MTNGDKLSLSKNHASNTQSDIKYGFALDKDNNVVGIGSGQRGHNYSCLSCGKKLIPVLKDGQRRKHFRHAANETVRPCSPETYLHKLATTTFYQTYSECLANNNPYFLEFNKKRQCNACNGFGPCDVSGHVLEKIDLTQYYTEISHETYDGKFKPDILLYGNTMKGNRISLWVEIAVTHFIDEKKEKFGERIVEISATDDVDVVELIKSCCLSENDFRVTTYNLKPAPVIGKYTTDCTKKMLCFVLYSSGKPNRPYLLSMTPIQCERIYTCQ